MKTHVAGWPGPGQSDADPLEWTFSLMAV